MVTAKKLTIRYSIHFLLYYSICAGTSSFAATYLLDKGFHASQVGILLAVSNLLSCFLQPIIGDFVDRLKSFQIPQIVTAFLTGALICYGVIHFIKPSIGVLGILYCAGLLLMSVTNSLCSSLCAYYTNHNYPINYGMGTGVGSLAFSFASLGCGYLIAWLGSDAMLQSVLLLLILLIIVVWGYPRLKNLDVKKANVIPKDREQSVSLVIFFKKYKNYTMTMVGVMFIAMCHMMSENYFISLFEKIGGGSEDVGIALFIACMTAAPFYMVFEKIIKKLSIYKMMKMAGIFFMIKSILLLISTQVWHVYAIELLQLVTYGFIYQPLYYYAREKIAEVDLVKGQSVYVATFTLGAAIGNFVGGRMLDAYGIDGLLKTALMAACIGTVIIAISLRKEK